MKNFRLSFSILFLFIGILFLNSCKPEDPIDPISGPTPYVLTTPGNWPQPNLLAENPLTEEGVALGRQLFYDAQLSKNGTQSCADCHHQNDGFTDLQKQFSTGSEGLIGNRNSMPLFNLNWASGYFWNGRQPTLESLIEEPMEAHNEMNLDIEEGVERLKKDPNYPSLFNAAFPNQGITSTTLRYAIAQFLRTIISGNTKWDQYLQANPRNPEKLMTPQEARGYFAFISEDKGDCFHCHSPINPFLINMNERQFANNGLDANPDTGYFKATGKPNDWGKFKTASLRNLAFTAPYMHDGRFATLMEVLDHYDNGITYSTTVDPVIIKHMDQDFKPIPRLTQQDKEDIIAFLMLMTDSSLLTEPKWAKP
ncbi:MAG: cytochrome-c peroxidase [Bacteroidota bacterium]|nr:cytochrome-c peroxidase [Bacteroidota bacterium]MDX5431578.1 cytochrome-c peroxidase [Bacteroidota bacterium]MDX5470298.1 cytochrome-c peroxidase [Bacteroidota bacterium]